MRILPTPIDRIRIPPDRQRIEFTPEEVAALATSISSVGIIHPIVLRATAEGFDLVAGWRRLKALHYLWNMGETIRCGKEIFPEGVVPSIDQGTLTDLEAYELELAENIYREDLSWQDKARATAKFAELKQGQAALAGNAPLSYADLAAELRPEVEAVSGQNATREEILLSSHLDDADIAAAPNRKAAFKILKRKEELKQSAKLGEMVGKTFSAADHSLLHADSLDWMVQWSLDTPTNMLFDILLTDPIYGMNAQDFADSGGKANGAHFYDDTYETWQKHIDILAYNAWRLTKSQAHAYIFCDFDRFHELKQKMEFAGWEVFRTPLIWVNPTANRAPWPEHGPHRKWQAILYAMKGKKMVNSLKWDVLTHPSDVNLNHQAQKPIALYQDLLSRSAKPGDSVLDPFCGTGPIFPAAHALKVKATGLEIDDSAYGIAVKRLGELK